MLIYQKLSYLVFLILVMLLVFTSQSIDKHELYGKWAGESENYELFFEFKSNQRFKFSFNNKTLKNTKIIQGNFVVDYSKKPITLSLSGISDKLSPLHTVIKFRGNNLIFMEKFSSKEKFRPLFFSCDSNMVLKRGL